MGIKKQKKQIDRQTGGQEGVGWMDEIKKNLFKEMHKQKTQSSI